MKILVTGGAGFIGSHVAERYLEEGFEVAVIDDLSVGDAENVPEEASFYEADIADREALKAVIDDFKPDIINHHAAHNDSMDSLEKPREDAELNIIGSINLLELARDNDVEKIIYASSGGLSYGEPQEIPTPEDHEMQPSYPYGISKHTVEHYLELYRDLYDLDFVVLRYASVYGPRANGGVIKNFLEAVEEDEEPIIFGEGTQTRDFIHVEDVADANFRAVEKGEGYYNIGTCTETSINELWSLVADVTESDREPDHRDRWIGDIDRCRLDYSRAEKDLNWEPKTGLREGISRTWNYF